jgi:hypothetical protein
VVSRCNGDNAVFRDEADILAFCDWLPDRLAQARKLYGDAQEMLDTMINEKWLRANGVIGFFPANAVGDDIEVYADDTRTEVLATLRNLRQQGEHRAGIPNRSLGDYIAPGGAMTVATLERALSKLGLDVNWLEEEEAPRASKEGPRAMGRASARPQKGRPPRPRPPRAPSAALDARVAIKRRPWDGVRGVDEGVGVVTGAHFFERGAPWSGAARRPPILSPFHQSTSPPRCWSWPATRPRT